MSQKEMYLQPNPEAIVHTEAQLNDMEQDLATNLNTIRLKEPEFYAQVCEVVNHFAKTYGDKYEAGASPINTKQQLYDQKRGKAINIYQTSRYMQRYDTAGFSKSENPVDLYKGIHFLFFELLRLARQFKLAPTRTAPDATN
jgi:hypothetical protein